MKTLVILGILLAIAAVAMLFLPTMEEMASSTSSVEDEFEIEDDPYVIGMDEFMSRRDKAERATWLYENCHGQELAELGYQYVLEGLMESVDSSALLSVGYSPEAELLAVEFENSGEIYVYEGVSERVYDSLMESDSIGNYFYYNIRDSYEYWRIDD